MKEPAVLLDDLARQRPEWGPWLAVVRVALRECNDSRWDAAVPVAPLGRTGSPLVDGAAVRFDPRSAVRFLRQLADAGRDGTSKMATIPAAMNGDVNVGRLLEASVRQDTAIVVDLARRWGADTEALLAIVSILATPFLHACRRRWGAPVGWTKGHCPICGAWPTFAEVRGIERSRYLRCGRCGGEWQAPVLCCVYCGSTDHERLRSLVPEPAGPHSIDACTICLGYLKTFTSLRGCPPAGVMIEDLATVDLDVAAVEAGYRRPEGNGGDVALSFTEDRPRRGLFAWNA